LRLAVVESAALLTKSSRMAWFAPFTFLAARSEAIVRERRTLRAIAASCSFSVGSKRGGGSSFASFAETWSSASA
jgi:hypothetical protein